MAKKKARVRKKNPDKTKKKLRHRKLPQGTGSTGPRLRKS